MYHPITAGKVEHRSNSGFESPPVDLAALRAYRYARVQQLLLANDCAAALLIDPAYPLCDRYPQHVGLVVT